MLSVPVYHLDRLFWNPGWVQTPRAEFAARQADLVGRDRWIMDGNYASTMELRLQAADTIIFLDFPRWLCIQRVLRRALFERNRPDMPEGCLERFDWEFIQFLYYIWTFPKQRRKHIEHRLRELSPEQTVIRLGSPDQVTSFLSQLTA
jgi:adenylate kinase family enzyme